MITNGFAGTGALLRLILRLDRIKMVLWLVGILTIVAITPLSLRSILDTEAEAQGVTAEVVLAQQAALVGTNGASIALQGPPDALDTYGGRYAFEIGAFTLAIVALMNILLVGRHTRGEEESGRAELVRAASVGPWAPLAAVGLVALAANLILGAVTSGIFIADGLDAGRSLLYGSSITLCGLIFAAISLIWVQVFEYGRPATGMSLAGLGVAFALRAVGDVRDNWLSWLSPLGWVQAINSFGEVRIWPFVVSILAIVACVVTAVMLVVRRDVGAGLVQQRPGPPVAASSLLTPMGFAWRLQKSIFVWWAIGAAFLGAVYGSVISAIDDFVEQTESMRDVLESLGMTGDALRDGFITVILSLVALITTGGVIQLLLRPRGEEGAGRAEPVLGTALSRRAWLGSHVLLAAVAAPVFMLAAAIGMVTVDGLIAGEFIDPGGAIVAALARVPALWATAGVGVLLYGLARRLSLGVWAVFMVGLVIFLFGDLLRLPDWVTNLSPVAHVTHLPGGDQGWLSLVVLSAVAVVATVAGLVAFDRRDIETA
ncbi:MAG: ABC transporter permease [Actinomycetota bacterium]